MTAVGGIRVVLFDLDDTLFAHREAVEAGIAAHRAALGGRSPRPTAVPRRPRGGTHSRSCTITATSRRARLRRAAPRAGARIRRAVRGEPERCRGRGLVRGVPRRTTRARGRCTPDAARLPRRVERAASRIGIITNGELRSRREDPSASDSTRASSTSSRAERSASRSPIRRSSAGGCADSVCPPPRPATSATGSAPTRSAPRRRPARRLARPPRRRSELAEAVASARHPALAALPALSPVVSPPTRGVARHASRGTSDVRSERPGIGRNPALYIGNKKHVLRGR